VLGQRLAAARRAGVTFEEAWPQAVEAAILAEPDAMQRADWERILPGMVQTWRDAFERQPAGRSESAAAALLDDERVPIAA
jgi:hypothetical protein